MRYNIAYKSQVYAHYEVVMTCKECENIDKRIAELRQTVQIATERIIKVKRQNRELRQEVAESKASTLTVSGERESVGSKARVNV